MTVELTRQYLTSVGATDDEIFALTAYKTGNDVFQRSMYTLVTGTCVPSVDLISTLMLFLGYGQGQTKPPRFFGKIRGMSLAIERIAPMASQIFKRDPIWNPIWVKRFMIKLVDASRLEAVAKVLELSDLEMLDCCHFTRRDSVDFDLITRTTTKVVVNCSHVHMSQLSRCLSNLLFVAWPEFKEGILKAIFEGAQQHANPETILFSIAQEQIMGKNSILHEFLSCPHEHGLDPFVVGESPPGCKQLDVSKYVTRAREMVNGVIQVVPVSDIVMSYFCKVK